MWHPTRKGDASTDIGRAALLVSEEKRQRRGGSAGATTRQGPGGALAGTPARRGHGVMRRGQGRVDPGQGHWIRAMVRGMEHGVRRTPAA